MNTSRTHIHLEMAACPLCGPEPGTTIRENFDPFRVVTCNNCGLVFLSPRLTEKAILKLYSDEKYYVSEVAGQGYDEYLEVRPNWIRTFTRRLDQIGKYQKPGKALDIGCGPGFFLEAAQAKGYEAHGLDPSDYIVKVAREKFGDRIRHGVIEKVDYAADEFDLVVAMDTFEHIYHPLKWLEAVRRIVKPGGLIAMTTPNPASFLSKISGRNWVSYKLPEHVFYWSPFTIRRVLEKDWEVLEINRAGQYATLGFLFRRLFRINSAPGGLLKSLLTFLNKFSLYSDNGSLTVIARKK
ncbi:MAG: Ubiquinone biosynthesis O-methyltransferase [Anaerolineales bacterium]|nr:Ubiquinone biosynthesis O-methyltransferase [Anaerolineales bacterium]